MARIEDIKPTPDFDDRSTPVWAGFKEDETPVDAGSPYKYEEELVVTPFDEALLNVVGQQFMDDPDINAKVRIRRVKAVKEAHLKSRSYLNRIRINSSFPISQMREILAIAKRGIFSDSKTNNAITREQSELFVNAIQKEIAKEKERRSNTPNPDIG
ncbi:MAG TPA: hypothetical protein VHE53_00095 [Patescibacteria group bacterium]|nr:hypothetical protein [Patescibacteria group bacterium]